MPSSTRTFIAIALPEPVIARLRKVQNDLAPEFPAARWSHGGSFHLTLAFLGDVLDSDLSLVCRKVAEAAAPHRPFDLSLEGIGLFPNADRPRVIWAGLTAPDLAPLLQLRRAVAEACRSAGYRPDDRFTPHVSLGRIREDRRRPRPASVPPLRDKGPASRFEGWTGGTFRVSAITTYSSTLDPEGPTYTPLSTAQLSGKKIDASP
ncbi:RNA 2',3'-cyclic phosphodiesterase [Aquisphaera insulae]|uniref:RNA 2',3'-cyclic phosphodiesterase n=1 Tax=Aquisphaera insulae TaxID=2712864 RepID=UPI0013EB8C8D|nr:RNA 2',3'-cyclic phosphodiesterase [Aquisphaera insulae]